MSRYVRGSDTEEARLEAGRPETCGTISTEAPMAFLRCAVTSFSEGAKWIWNGELDMTSKYNQHVEEREQNKSQREPAEPRTWQMNVCVPR